MKCPNCQTVNPEDFRFCQECGQKLAKPQFCPSCGNPNPKESKFCSECGHSFQTDPANNKATAEQPPVPSPQTQTTQHGQPNVVYVVEQQPKQSFNLFGVLWRFASSTAMGYLLTEVGKYLFSEF